MTDDKFDDIEERRRQLADAEREAEDRLKAARAARKAFSEEHPQKRSWVTDRSPAIGPRAQHRGSIRSKP